jgi:hypothetical protein
VDRYHSSLGPCVSIHRFIFCFILLSFLTYAFREFNTDGKGFPVGNGLTLRGEGDIDIEVGHLLVKLVLRTFHLSNLRSVSSLLSFSLLAHVSSLSIVSLVFKLKSMLILAPNVKLLAMVNSWSLLHFGM